MEFASLWKNRGIRLGLALWAVAGFIFWLFLMFNFDPLGGKVALGDPIRQLISFEFSFGFALPIGLLELSYAANQPRWMAPRGKYVEGRKYPVLTIRRVVTIGILAAAYTALRFFELAHLDWAAMACALATVYFGPFEGFFVIFIGIFTGGIMIGTSLPPHTWLSFMTYEGVIWSLIGVVWWKFVEPYYAAKSRLPRFILYVVLASVIHTTFVYGHWMSTMVWGTLWTELFYWFTMHEPTTIVAYAVAGIVTESICRASPHLRAYPPTVGAKTS
jgi:hypothetical protein